MTGNALPENEISGQLNSESAAVYVLDAEVGKLNDYIEAKEQDNLPGSVTIYFSKKLLISGENNIIISSGCNADCSDHDDFEFYNLRLEIIPETG